MKMQLMQLNHIDKELYSLFLATFEDTLTSSSVQVLVWSKSLRNSGPIALRVLSAILKCLANSNSVDPVLTFNGGKFSNFFT